MLGKKIILEVQPIRKRSWFYSWIIVLFMIQWFFPKESKEGGLCCKIPSFEIMQGLSSIDLTVRYHYQWRHKWGEEIDLTKIRSPIIDVLHLIQSTTVH